MPKSLFRKIAIPSNISNYLSRTLIVITVANTLLIGGVLIIQQTLYFNHIIEQKSKEYIENQKTYVQDIIKNELEYIRIQNEIFKKKINEEIRQNVIQAIYTAESIYQKYAGIKSDDEIKALIIASISSLRFDMEYEEVFISTLNGTGVFYPRKPEFTGKDMRNFKDANGSSVISDVYHFNKKYKSDFDRFFNFFYSSQSSYDQLNISELYFDDFKRAGVAANEMIIHRKETENVLVKEHEKATESDRLKSSFLANMSHEIRTPMNAIIGFSELLDDDNQEEKDKVLFIKLIKKNSETLLNLINDIVDISKIEANLLSVSKRPVQLSIFLSEIGTHYTEILASKKDKNILFQIISEINPEVSILTDEIRLRQILDNLIGNAIKFTSSGSVIVNVKMDGKTVHFSVTDTGIGIPYYQQEIIFERFMQAEQGHQVNFGGTGLGLAISKNLIHLLGGSIRVESEPGKGSTFHFEILAS